MIQPEDYDSPGSDQFGRSDDRKTRSHWSVPAQRTTRQKTKVYAGLGILATVGLGGLLYSRLPPPSPITRPEIVKFEAEPGLTATSLSWAVKNAANVFIDNGVGAVPESGTVTVSPETDTTYSIKATSGASAVTSPIFVRGYPKPKRAKDDPRVLSFAASPASKGDGTTITWNVMGAEAISIDQGVGTVPSRGSLIVSPLVDTTYTLRASGAKTSVTSQVKVVAIKRTLERDGIAHPPRILSFAASPSDIQGNNGNATLSWTVSDSDEVTIDNGVGAVAATGNTGVRISSTTTFTLRASNEKGTTTARSTVNLTPPQHTAVKLAPEVLGRFEGLSSRSKAIEAVLNGVRERQRAAGLDLRADLVALEVQMKSALQRASIGVATNDESTIQPALDSAQAAIEKAEMTLNIRH